MGLDEVVQIFATADFRWWVAGGRALALHVGDSWREHGDTDVGLCRRDAPAVLQVLAGWDLHVASVGVLTPWDGRPLVEAQNNLWCRRTPTSPWVLDILVGDGNDEWVYRRDPTVRRPWDEAVLTTAGRVPYLAPELQLLFKSRHPRPKDDLDASIVVPRLDPASRSWLADRLPGDHPWQPVLAARASESTK